MVCPTVQPKKGCHLLRAQRLEITDKYELNFLSVTATKNHKIPLFSFSVPAGFPSPADDYIEAALDLNDLLIKRPAATFFVRVSGESMEDFGIRNSDILVVDRSIKPTGGKIIIAAIDGQLTVKQLKITGKNLSLIAGNTHYATIEITPENDFYVWGVVTSVIHRFNT